MRYDALARILVNDRERNSQRFARANGNVRFKFCLNG